MKIEYYHASKYGNGAMVADEFKKQMTAKGVTVNVHHVREAIPKEIPVADLYLFSSPGRFGKPIGDMQHFLKKAHFSPGTKYAVLATELCPNPDGKARIPTVEEVGKCQRVIPEINRILHEKSMVCVAEGKIFVTGIKGPLENNWEKYLEEFVTTVPVSPNTRVEENPVELVVLT